MYDVDTMIPMEIGKSSLQLEQHDKDHNEDCLNTNLDLLVEKRERAQLDNYQVQNNHKVPFQVITKNF